MLTIETIDACYSLFLVELDEPKLNSLRIVLAEASLGALQNLPIPIKEAGVEIKDVRPIRHSRGDQVFEITWETYVAYQVVNESWVLPEKGEFQGRRIRHSSKSGFLDYIGVTTWANDQIEKFPRVHWRISCEDHAIDVVSVDEPLVKFHSLSEESLTQVMARQTWAKIPPK